MHWLYMVVRYFPFLGLGLMAAFIQIAIFYRRKGSKMHWVWWVFAVVALGSVGAWIFLKGYEKSDEWVRAFTQIAPS